MEEDEKGNAIVLKDNSSSTGELFLVCQFNTRVLTMTQLGFTQVTSDRVGISPAVISAN